MTLVENGSKASIYIVTVNKRKKYVFVMCVIFKGDHLQSSPYFGKQVLLPHSF